MRYRGPAWILRKGAVVSLAATLAAVPAGAQQSRPEPALNLELNTVADAGDACRLTFLVTNGLGADVSSLVLETVIFTAGGEVERLTLFDFQEVPAGRPRVRQFDLSGTGCAALGSVLINGVDACEGPGLTAATCQAALRPSSRAGIEVTGS